MIDLQNKTVMVTGANSMIGRRVIESLETRNAVIYPIYHDDCDLTNIRDINFMFGVYLPDYVIHCATYSGNIDFNLKYPADVFYETSLMALNVLNACQRYDVIKVLSVLSSCAYPNFENGVIEEGKLWDGPCNFSINCHGYAKRNLDAYSTMLNRQYGLKAATVVLTNCYGEYDSYDVNKTKVVGGLINKFYKAKKENLPEVECWGTGKPLRELMYCGDAGECIVQSLQKYEDYTKPLNIGSQQEISIFDLVFLIKDIIGYKGNIKWLTEKPDGQMRKLLDSTTMQSLLKVEITPLREGIRKTIEWYEEHCG